MNPIDLAARLRELPPALPAPSDRFAEVEKRVRKRRAQRLVTTSVVAVAASAMLVPFVLDRQSPPDVSAGEMAIDPTGGVPTTSPPAPPASLPGTDRVIKLSEPLTHQATGTSTVELGVPPAQATAVSFDFTCLTAGTFRFPDGASIMCDDDDAESGTEGGTTSPGYVMKLAPGQSDLVIRTAPTASWRVVATYVRTERTPWAINARGETYGAQTATGSPDLIAVSGSDGERVYAKNEDLNAAGPENPEEAVQWMKYGQIHGIPTYATDGTTIVDTFEFSDSIPHGGSSGTPNEAEDEGTITLINGAPPGGTSRASASGLLTVSGEGCVHLDTDAGRRWIILPWGMYLSGTRDDGQLRTLDGTFVLALNEDVAITGAELTGQRVDVPCGTGLPPLYLTQP